MLLLHFRFFFLLLLPVCRSDGCLRSCLRCCCWGWQQQQACTAANTNAWQQWQQPATAHASAATTVLLLLMQQMHLLHRLPHVGCKDPAGHLTPRMML
jgi:hypothetical protein